MTYVKHVTFKKDKGNKDKKEEQEREELELRSSKGREQIVSGK